MTSSTPPTQGTSRIVGAQGTVSALRDKNGRVRSRATLPGFRKGQAPGNKGMRFIVERITLEELDMLVSGRSRTSASGQRDRCLMQVAFCSGLRISELLALRPDDITHENGAYRVLVRRGKGGKTRSVGMLPMAAPYLDTWLKTRAKLGVSDHAPLFCTIAQPNPGGPLGSPQVRTMLKRTAARVGLEKRVNPHLFRHSLAIHLSLIGTPLPIISMQLGHSNAGTTGIYLRSLSNDEVYDWMAAQHQTAEVMRAPSLTPPAGPKYGLAPNVADLVQAAVLEEALG